MSKIIYFRESWWQSLLSDIGSLAMLTSAMAINHYLLGDNLIWTIFLIGSILLMISSKASPISEDFNSFNELKEYIEEEALKETKYE